MNNLKLKGTRAELDEFLAEIRVLLLEDPSESKAAAMLLSLIAQGTIDPEVAQHLYGAAVKLVYFTGEKGSM